MILQRPKYIEKVPQQDEAPRKIKVHAINAAAVYHTIRSKKCRRDEIFTISMKDILKHHKKEKHKEDINTAAVLPKEYYNFLDVFKKRPPGAPPIRGTDVDVHIKLKEGATLPRTQGLRRISEEEAKIVEQFVRDNLAKGFITPSSFEYASPILFIRK